MTKRCAAKIVAQVQQANTVEIIKFPASPFFASPGCLLVCLHTLADASLAPCFFTSIPTFRGQVLMMLESIACHFLSSVVHSFLLRMPQVPGHHPWAEEYGPGVYAAMFRDPRKRLFSAFNYGRHAMGSPKNSRDRLRLTTTVEAFAAFPGIRDCQVCVIPSVLF